MITLVRGDITESDVDVIVNSGNDTLLGDDGVDGAIHIAAGPELREHCKTLGGCQVAEVKVTPSFNLPHKYIIHTVAPQQGNESGREAHLLELCYRNCLEEADKLGVKSVAFPSLSTGQYGFPLDRGAQIALETIHDYLSDFAQNIEEVVMVLYDSSEFNDEDRDTYAAYKDAARRKKIPIKEVASD